MLSWNEHEKGDHRFPNFNQQEGENTIYKKYLTRLEFKLRPHQGKSLKSDFLSASLCIAHQLWCARICF